MRKNIKKILISSLAMVMVVGTVAVTAPQITKKNIPATFGRVNVTVDGENVTNKVEGFISNGVTYMPLRAISNVFGYTVNWNANTNMATLNSSGDNPALLKQQLRMKDVEIARLEDELKKAKDGTSSVTGKSMRDIESDLQKDYDRFENIDWSIRLKGDNRSIDLEVEVDLGTSREKDRWDDLRDRDIETFIEDMVNDIQRDYRDADVKGYIRDSDAREDLYTFDKRGSRRIDITRKTKTNASRSDMERDLEDKFRYLNDDKRDFSIRSFTVKEPYTDEYEIQVKTNAKEKDMTFGLVNDFYKDVRDFFEGEYRNAKVKEIEIQDTNGDRLDRKTY